MFYRTTLIACCVLAAILMAAIFYNAISALIEREMSQLHTVYAINDHPPGALGFSGRQEWHESRPKGLPQAES
jgi:hypothetical protein